MALARAAAEEAATLLRAGFTGEDGSANAPDVAEAYSQEWKRVTEWVDLAPVAAYHYTCQSEWTGGRLDGPGDQNVVRWPSSFGFDFVERG